MWVWWLGCEPTFPRQPFNERCPPSVTSIQAACSIAGFVNCFGCTVYPHFEPLGQVDVKVLSLKTSWHLQLQSGSVMFMNFLCKQTVFDLPLETQVWCYGLIWPFYQANAWKKNLGYKGVTITWMRCLSRLPSLHEARKRCTYFEWVDDIASPCFIGRDCPFLLMQLSQLTASVAGVMILGSEDYVRNSLLYEFF